MHDKEQLDLFGGAPPPPPRDLVQEPRTRSRREDPKTSKAAAQKLTPFGHAHHATIYETLKRIVTGTFYEISDACELTPQQVWRRLSELEELQLVEILRDDGGVEITRPGPSGRGCRVWRIKL